MISFLVCAINKRGSYMRVSSSHVPKFKQLFSQEDFAVVIGWAAPKVIPLVLEGETALRRLCLIWNETQARTYWRC